jgi:UDP-N-acetylglucosamine/UDP-N-acetylgalactosamine diphosphorylase
MEQLSVAKKERSKRLEAMAEKAVAAATMERLPESTQRREFHERLKSIGGAFTERVESDETKKFRESFLQAFQKATGNDKGNYIAAIQSLPAEVSSKGVRWLSSLVDGLCVTAAKAVPSLGLFKNQR